MEVTNVADHPMVVVCFRSEGSPVSAGTAGYQLLDYIGNNEPG